MDKKSLIITVLAVLLAAVIAGGGVYIWQNNDEEPEQQETTETTADENADDEAEKNDETETVTESEEETPVVDDETQIIAAMAARHSKNVSDVDLTINENDGTHAQGLVKFVGEIAGAWWLAAKDASGWTIVADGNGTVMCTDIAPYNFPTSMVPECWDDTTNTLVTR